MTTTLTLVLEGSVHYTQVVWRTRSSWMC
ncbi:hypothetical protein CFP56_010856 [Quercus suber]|uniref:Uncharacterized protein n=1 Tax=Quercus suber TaxID=58331 RepID=A0AAW0KYT9_QUESU